jgi:hypothetical protein
MPKIKDVMSNLSNFKGKGKLFKIGQISKRDFVSGESVTFLKVIMEMEFSNQHIEFYMAQSDDQPQAFKIITKNFGQYGLKIGDEFGFDFNIIKNIKGETKLKIWSIYNTKRNS